MADSPQYPSVDSTPLKFDSLPSEFKNRFAQRMTSEDAIKNFARTSKANGSLCAKYHIAILLEQEHRNRPTVVYQQPVPQRPFPPWDFPRRDPGGGSSHIPGAPRPWMI